MPLPLFVRLPLITHLQVVLERATFLLTQQFPQGVEIATGLQIPHRKVLTQQERTHALPRDPSGLDPNLEGT
jgi:acyl CoA:acetate/3-ketoacid CoA transferase